MEKQHLGRNNYTCSQLAKYFSVNKQTIISADINYVLCRVFIILTPILWLLALIIMIIRFILAVDFQLILVTISKVDASNSFALTKIKSKKKVMFHDDNDDENSVAKRLEKDEVSRFVSEVVSKFMNKSKKNKNQ